MSIRSLSVPLLACAFLLAIAGCRSAPGRPAAIETESLRPEQVLDFATLDGQNCAGCHGANGRNGAAISLANPVYLAFAGARNIARVTSAGLPGTLMPPFAKESGGTLTDQQVQIIANGVVSHWGNPNALAGQTLPPYASSLTGNPANGQKAFATYCASCHGPDATGTGIDNNGGKKQLGSLVDPAYLALISDQGLRSIIVAGAPKQGMPDWRSDAGAQPMTDQQVTDIVAWLVSFRTQTPGQPYTAQQ